MYAIIEDSGTQIMVREGDTILVDPRDLADDQLEITFPRVLMLGGSEGGEGGDGGEARIGAPLIEGASVTADILEEGRLPKVRIQKFKRRKGYKRLRGHRQPYLKVRITGISG